MDTPDLLRLVLDAVSVATEDEYLVRFVDRDGGPDVVTRCRLRRDGDAVVVAGFEPDVIARWMGDAESVRSVAAAVSAVDRARRLSLRDYE